MIKRYFILPFILLLSISLFAQVSPKRGIAYGDHSVADMNALKPGISWWYNWTDQPDNALRANYANLGVEYVPMTWNASFDVNTVIARIRPGTKYILAFNEPNLRYEANMTVEQVVAAWPRLEQIAAAKNLEIVSAVPIYGGDVNFSDPVAWHRRFFELCPTCKVDYIAFHTYEKEAGGAIFLTRNLTVFNRPVWVTEFADYDAGTDQEEKQYLQDVLKEYESNPDIFRYSWFTGRRAGVPRINLLAASSGVLTDLGSTYVKYPYRDKMMNVPGRIVGNKHYRRKGTGLENTTDGGTGQNICYVDAGDWAEFMVNVANAGTYAMTFRMAAQTNAGKFDISVNGVIVKKDISFAATGGWQTWVDVPASGIQLPKGEAYIKIIYRTAGLNFNYIDVKVDPAAPVDVADLEAEWYDFYPNPFADEALLRINSRKKDQLSIKIIDMNGAVCYASDDHYSNEDIYLGKGLAHGVYSVMVTFGDAFKTFKIVKM